MGSDYITWVGSKRVSQHAKQAKALKQETSPPSLPLWGFKMLSTGDYDSEEEEDFTEQNVGVIRVNKQTGQGGRSRRTGGGSGLTTSIRSTGGALTCWMMAERLRVRADIACVFYACICTVTTAQK
jgi:hypothetical protein